MQSIISHFKIVYEQNIKSGNATEITTFQESFNVWCQMGIMRKKDLDEKKQWKMISILNIKIQGEESKWKHLKITRYINVALLAGLILKSRLILCVGISLSLIHI